MIIGIDASKSAVENKTGIENFVYQLILALSKLNQKNTFYLYTDTHLPEELKTNNNFIEKFVPPHRFWNKFHLSRALLRDKPECYLQPTYSFPPFAPKKSAAVVHDLAWLKFPCAYTLKQRLTQRWTLFSICRKATELICVSESTRKDLIAHKPFTRNKSTVVYLAGGNYEPVSHPKDVLNLKSDYFLAGGRLDQRKNIANVVEAYYLARDKGVKEKLVLIGDPGFGYEKILTKIDSRYEYKKDIIMPGFMGPDKLKDLIPGASAFIFPSRYEGFGLPVLEAMQAGTPVITANISSLPEVAGDAAILVNPENPSEIAESMLNIVLDQVLRADLINKGRIQASKFTWARTAQHILQVLEDL